MPAAARDYTFAALVTRREQIAEKPELIAAAAPALVRTQQCLKQDSARATQVGKTPSSLTEVRLIAERDHHDLSYYDFGIAKRSIGALNGFARNLDILAGSVAYDQVGTGEFSHLWWLARHGKF